MIKPSNKYIQMQKAQEAFEKANKLAKTLPSKFRNMTQQQVIVALRKSRERLWNEKVKNGVRHQ